jgi:glycine/D-amino acid oxidase-like deaminating enzyme
MIKDRADVVIIGGGVVGCATAYYLAKRKAKVILIEKGDIGEEQSSRAWGFVRQQGRDPVEMPLMIASNQIWQSLSEELNSDLEWVQGGNLALANDEKRLDEFRNWLDVAREFDVDTQILSRDEVKKLIPGMEGPFVGGMFTPSDGHAEPLKVTRAFAKAAQDRGAMIYPHCAAEGIEVSNGQVSSVVTEKGVIKTSVVVCVAGAWSSKIARMVGLSVPLQVLRATAAATTTSPPFTKVGVWAPGIAFRQRSSGSFYIAGGASLDVDITLDTFRYFRYFLPNYLKNKRLFRLRIGRELLSDFIGTLPGSQARKHPFTQHLGVEPKPNEKTVVRTHKNFATLLPGLTDIGIQRMWAGRIDATPDAVPILGEVESLRGFLFATGFSGHGFGMAPAVGKLVSEIAIDGESSLDIYGMRYNRFREGDIGRPKNVL